MDDDVKVNDVGFIRYSNRRRRRRRPRLIMDTDFLHDFISLFENSSILEFIKVGSLKKGNTPYSP